MVLWHPVVAGGGHQQSPLQEPKRMRMKPRQRHAPQRCHEPPDATNLEAIPKTGCLRTKPGYQRWYQRWYMLLVVPT